MGNLVFSVGIMVVMFGFKMIVYMFYDVCQWKKDKLWVNGVIVEELNIDFLSVILVVCVVVVKDDYMYFVDDEGLCDLFFGYVVVGVWL